MDTTAKYQSSNRRIAKNTLFLYLRQILILVVSLYTSRVVLQTLGADDYGIYSLIGSFVALFGVISGSFVVAITRYMAYAMGKNDAQKLALLYSTAVWMMLLLGGAIAAAVIVSGFWYVQSIMVLPAERIEATLYVLVFSAISFYINMLSVPYTSLIVAHEKMQAFAYIAFAEVLFKLVIVFVLPLVSFDKLITYAFLTVTAALAVRLIYMWYCKSQFAECRFSWHMDKFLLKDMMKFVQWAFLGNGAVVLKEQGISIVLNLFLGTTINAARGLANSVNCAVSSFVNNFIQAVQPQITKLYSSGQHEEMCRLIYISSRFSYYLIFILSLPLIKNIDYVLNIWLGEIPLYTAIFIALTLADSLISGLSRPLLYGTLAEGHIKVYEIFLTITYLASLPISYAILYAELSPVWVYVMLIILRIMVLSYLVWQSKLYGMQLEMFLQNVIKFIFIVTVLSVLFAYWIDLQQWISCPFWCFCLESLLVILVTGILILTIGISSSERTTLFQILKSKIHKI